VFLISAAVLLAFILLEIIREFVFIFIRNYIFNDLGEISVAQRFFSSMDDIEIHMILGNFTSTVVLWGAVSIASAVLILFLRKFKTNADIDINNRVSFKFKMPKNALMLMIVGLAIMYMFVSVSIVFDSFLGLFGIGKIIFDDAPFFPQTGIGIFMYFFALVVTPSIVEEFFCRYLILNALRKYGDGFAITVSSVFFGLLHGRTNAFFFATAIGFFLAYFAIKTKSIWFPIILHAFINSMAIFWHFVSDLTNEGLFNFIFWSTLAIIFALAIIYVIILIAKKKDLSLVQRKDYIHIGSGRKLFVFFNVATIIFIILALLQSSFEYYIIR